MKPLLWVLCMLAAACLVTVVDFAYADMPHDPAAPDAVGPLNCATATSPVVAYDITKGQLASDVQSFFDDLNLNGFSAGTISGSIPSCVDVLVIRGLRGTQALSSPYSAAQATTIKNWVDAGHAVMIMSDWGTLTSGVNALFSTFGRTQTADRLTDPNSADSSHVGGDWIYYQADNFAAHPILFGVTEVEFLVSSWFSPATSAIIISDGDSNPESVPVMAAFTSGGGCAVLASDSDWVTNSVPQVNAGYFKRDNDVLAVNTISWLRGCGRAPTSNPGGPYSVNEGSSIALTGSGSIDPNSLPLTYAWDLDNDGQYDDAFVANTTFSAATKDDGVYNVSLRVSNGSYTDIGWTTVTVLNVAPSVVLNGSASTVVAGTPITFTGSFSDPGVLDTHVQRWNFGNGTPNVFGSLTRVYTYTNNGTYTTVLTVTDDDGGAGQATYKVIVTGGQSPPISVRGYLPIIFHNFCANSVQRADIALAIDISGSMANTTDPGGLSKLEAAKIAATRFINLLTIPGDQAAIIWFKGSAGIAYGLSSNRTGLIAALEALNANGTTRIDLGLGFSREELTSSRHIALNSQIIILLTDGHPNGGEASDVIAQADAAKAIGITIYTIGLGNGVNGQFLQAVATSPAHYYASPNADQLNSIYEEIEGTLHCH